MLLKVRDFLINLPFAAAVTRNSPETMTNLVKQTSNGNNFQKRARCALRKFANFRIAAFPAVSRQCESLELLELFAGATWGLCAGHIIRRLKSTDAKQPTTSNDPLQSKQLRPRALTHRRSLMQISRAKRSSARKYSAVEFFTVRTLFRQRRSRLIRF